MKAAIMLDVPEWQIGQKATVYFPDTMCKEGVCEADQTDALRRALSQVQKSVTLLDVFGRDYARVTRCAYCEHAEPLHGHLYCNKLLKWTEEEWHCADGVKKR